MRSRRLKGATIRLKSTLTADTRVPSFTRGSRRLICRRVYSPARGASPNLRRQPPPEPPAAPLQHQGRAQPEQGYRHARHNIEEEVGARDDDGESHGRVAVDEGCRLHVVVDLGEGGHGVLQAIWPGEQAWRGYREEA